MKQFDPKILIQLRGYARTNGEILVCSKLEFVAKFDDLEAAEGAVAKFKNAADAVIGYGEATQVRFTPR